MAKIERLRFTIEDDLRLLRDVVGINPFLHPVTWKVVHNNICKFSGKCFSVRAVREHVEHLLKLFAKEDKANLRKSGTEEQYREKEILLQEVTDLQREFKLSNPSSSKDTKVDSIRTKGILARNAACATIETAPRTEETEADVVEFEFPEYAQCNNAASTEHTFNEDDSSSNENNENVNAEAVVETPMMQEAETTQPIIVEVPASKSIKNNGKQTLGPVRTRKSRLTAASSALSYLKEKQEWERKAREQEFAFEERKLELEERKLRLEEQKHEMEMKERESRLALELKEREQNLEATKQQMNAINLFMKYFIDRSNK